MKNTVRILPELCYIELFKKQLSHIFFFHEIKKKNDNLREEKNINLKMETSKNMPNSFFF